MSGIGWDDVERAHEEQRGFELVGLVLVPGPPSIRTVSWHLRAHMRLAQPAPSLQAILLILHLLLHYTPRHRVPIHQFLGWLADTLAGVKLNLVSRNKLLLFVGWVKSLNIALDRIDRLPARQQGWGDSSLLGESGKQLKVWQSIKPQKLYDCRNLMTKPVTQEPKAKKGGIYSCSQSC